MSEGRLAGKSVAVTGAGGGLGRSFALTAAESGAVVLCLDSDGIGAEATAAEAARVTRGAYARTCDVTDAARVEEVLREMHSRTGRLDVLVNNAGVSDARHGPLHESDPAQWHRVIDVDLHGVYHGARSALALMLPQGRGKIVNVASVWGLVGSSGVLALPAYSAAKGAVINLTRELALEYAAHGIQVNALCPGFVRTGLGGGAYDDPAFVARLVEQVPIGRVADPRDLCGPFMFLASSDSDYVTGHALVVDGGYIAR